MVDSAAGCTARGYRRVSGGTRPAAVPCAAQGPDPAEEVGAVPRARSAGHHIGATRTQSRSRVKFLFLASLILMRMETRSKLIVEHKEPLFNS